MKLYPPHIEGKLPACTGNALLIPFIMNKSVSESQVSGIVALIKTISTGRVIATLTQGTLVKSNKGYIASFDNEKENNQIYNLTSGQYYKVQIAYRGKNEDIGYYSSVGVFKRTTMPKISVPLLENNYFNSYWFTGVYSQEGMDETEKIYSYCFELTDSDGNLISTSGECIHNSENDVTTKYSEDTWKLDTELQKDALYYLTYKVTTINGLECTSPKYITMSQDSVNINLNIKLQSKLDVENGCIELSLLPGDNGDSAIITGSFVLVRSSSKNNFQSWDEVYRFSYLNMPITKKKHRKIWDDCTVEQGEEYLYAIQAYNSRNLFSNRLSAFNGKVKVDFVDAFLYDGKYQLKIQFNPKVSSFKNNILESKVDTIGGQYPFIFRNGYTHYKEFSISGLISLLSDMDGKFSDVITANPEDNRRYTPAYVAKINNLRTNISADNIYNERQFKLKVLEWLNNGEPKVFRSPTEGNYIVRIMNVSLSPLDQLSRMLHTFQCTAYEIADWNFQNLHNFNLIQSSEESTSNIKIIQVQPKKMVNSSFVTKHNNSISFGKEVYGLNVTEATPGTMLKFIFSQGETPIIEIGNTSSYYVQTKEYGLSGLQLISGNWDDMKITFEYYDDTPTDSFSNIANLSLTDEIRRFIGPGYDFNIITKSAVANGNHIISDIRRDIGSFHYIRVERRFIQDIWPIAGTNQYSRNKAGNDIIKDNEWNPTIIYYDSTIGQYYNGNITDPMDAPDFRFRLNSSDNDIYTDLGPRLSEDSNSSVINTFGRIDAIRNVGDVNVLQIGSGLIADVSYRVRILEYVVESEDKDTINAKRNWENAKQAVQDAIADRKTMKEIEKLVQISKDKYTIFIQYLNQALTRKAG